MPTTDTQNNMKEREIISMNAVTRIRNTLARRLQNEGNLNVETPTSSRKDAESPVLDVEIELTGTETYSAQRDRVFSIFFENPFLYNRTEYVLIDGGVTEPNPDTNERWVKGTVTVMEHGDYRNIETPSTWSVQHEINTSEYNRLDLENAESGETIVAIENSENTLLLFDDASEKENLSSIHTKTFEDAVSRIEHYFRSDDPLIPKSDETG